MKDRQNEVQNEQITAVQYRMVKDRLNEVQNKQIAAV